MFVNDIHSQLNPTCVRQIVAPRSLAALRRAVWEAGDAHAPLAIAGGRHAMGGQQFLAGERLLDTTRLNRVLRFDREKGHVEAEAGITWPALVRWLLRAQGDAVENDEPAWGIAQKQTGADHLTLGGALAANVHGRGLAMRPLIADVEQFTLVDARGAIHTCSRTENAELFRLVIGGYGLFGVVYSVVLRLAPRQKLERVVEIATADDLMERFARRVADGFVYGDFQYAIDPAGDDFLRRGVFSCYRPVDPRTPLAKRRARSRRFSRKQYLDLIELAHVDKARAFQVYADYYRGTSEQVYWSDLHQLNQLGGYVNGYHAEIDRRLDAPCPASEVIAELFVPRPALAAFLETVRDDFRRHQVNVIYGTIRLIERDDESFLAWATQPCVGIIFNLHTEHSPHGLAHSRDAFRRLNDHALALNGGYYLTYHRHATRAQVLAAYSQFPDFLRRKAAHDGDERFQSDWYRHHKTLLAGNGT